METSAIHNLKVGSKLDYRQKDGTFAQAKITARTVSGAGNAINWLEIHYIGFRLLNEKCVIDNFKNWCKFAKHASITQRTSHRMKEIQCNDLIDICPSFKNHRTNKWITGTVCRKVMGQIQVLYFFENKDDSIWVHIDNVDEVAPFMTKQKD